MLAAGLALGVAIPETRGDKAVYAEFVQMYVVVDANSDGSWFAQPVSAGRRESRPPEVFLTQVGDDAVPAQAIRDIGAEDVFRLTVKSVSARGIVLSPNRDYGLILSNLRVGVTNWRSWWMRNWKAIEKQEAGMRIIELCKLAHVFLRSPYQDLVADKEARTPIADVFWRGIRSKMDIALQEVVNLSEAELITQRGTLRDAFVRCRALTGAGKSWEGNTPPLLQRAEDALNQLESRGVLRIINRSGRDLEVRLDTIQPSTYSLSQWIVEKRGSMFRLAAGGSHDVLVSEEPRWRRCSWRLPGSEIERGGDVREVQPGELVELQIKRARE